MNYADKRRRHQTKKMVRLQKPYLMGQQLDMEVDRVLGIADSGKMDWATLVESGKSTSQYSTPESVYPEIEKVADQFSIRQWVLYWHFKKKILKLQASGRTKSDYLALLKETATKVKPLSNTEKIQALKLFSDEVKKEPMTPAEAENLLMMKGLL